MFVPLRGLWWKCSCFDFETYGATINAAWAFCLLWLPVKSQSMRQEVGARQYQPMISWERKWVVLNVPKIKFMKWTARGNSTDIWHKFLYVNVSIRKMTRLDVGIVLSGIPVIVSTPIPFRVSSQSFAQVVLVAGLLHWIVHWLHFIVFCVLLYFCSTYWIPLPGTETQLENQ